MEKNYDLKLNDEIIGEIYLDLE